MIPHYEAFAKLQDVKSLRSFSLNTIAIVWDLESEPYSRILSICADRVEKRGDNHQTLRPDPNLFMAPIHRDVIGDFLRRWTAPDPTLFDKMITLQIVDSPRIILGKVVDGLVEVLGLDRPSDQAIDDALKAAGDYKVTTPYHPSAKAAQSVRYFGLSPEVNLPAIMKNVLPALPAEYAESARTTDAELKSANRYALEPHITLVHEKNVLAEREALGQSGSFGVHTRLWETCKTLAESKLSPMYAFDITYLVWDDRVMAFAVENLRPSGVEANIDLPEDVMRHLHVTVGTTSETIPAYESMGITRIARARMDEAKDMGEAKEAVDGSGPVKWVKMVGLKGEGRIKGMH